MTDFAVLGHWHLSSVFAPVLADLGYQTCLVNTGSESWTTYPQNPVAEPGLKDLVGKNLKDKKLSFSSLKDLWKARFAWIAIDTPVDENDQVDLSPVENAALVLREHPEVEIVFVSSQVPVGFCRELQKKLSKPVCYVPENLRLGKGIETFKNADRTVIGCDDLELGKKIEKLLSGFHTQFFLCDLPTAEMIKHATNAFLATSISFANEIASLAQVAGADPLKVGQALKLDLRIGKQAYVIPGLGFAGGTLPRDLRILESIGEKSVGSPLVKAVLSINQKTADHLLGWLQWYKKQNPKLLKILLMGYSYKADTDTLRRSLTVELAHKMAKAHPTDALYGLDPVMADKDLSEFPKSFHQIDPSQKESFDLVFVMTARPIFKELLAESNLLHPQSLLLDLVNLYSEKPKLLGQYRRLWDAREGGTAQ